MPQSFEAVPRRHETGLLAIILSLNVPKMKSENVERVCARARQHKAEMQKEMCRVCMAVCLYIAIVKRIRE